MASDPYQVLPEEPPAYDPYESHSDAWATSSHIEIPPARQYPSTSSAFSASAHPDEDWTKVSDLAERRRIQNRIAQRNYRRKIKERMQLLERESIREEEAKGLSLDKKENQGHNAEDTTKNKTVENRRNGEEAIGLSPDKPREFVDTLRLRVVDYAGVNSHILDRLRLSIESYIGDEIDWWPFPPINRLKSPQQARLCWKYGGQDLSIVVDKHDVQELVMRLQDHSQDSSILPMAHPSSIPPESLDKGSHQASYQPLWKVLLKRIMKISHVDAQTTSSTTNPTGNPRMETYLCVDKCWTTVKNTRMSTIRIIEDMKSDYDYFCHARQILSQAEGNWLQRKLSWRSYTRVNLLEFHFLWDDSDEIALETLDSLTTTQDLCRDYQFVRLKHLSLDVQMRICAEIILRGIHNPACGHNTTQLLDSIPKLLAPPGLERKQFASGWGFFYAGQSLCMQKVLGASGVLLAFGTAFVPYWLSSIDKLDLQTAMAPLSFLTTLIGIGLAMLAIAHN